MYAFVRLRRVIVRIYVIFLLCIIFHCEFLSYSSLSLKLPQFTDLKQSKQTVCRLKILIVADAQLIGYVNEPFWIGAVSRWDSDRYLRKTFSSVLLSFPADLVVFLGDLFDEGSTATDQDFANTMRRFEQIYSLNNAPFSPEFVPGDNDVGGEGSDPITEKKRQRFEQFSHLANFSKQIPCKQLSMYQANVLDGSWSKLFGGNNASLRVLFSHVSPYLNHNASLKILSAVSPHLVFSAHTHKFDAKIIGNDHMIQFGNAIDQNRVLTINFNSRGSMSHILLQSPTCSYRMGVTKMGFGCVVMNLFNNGTSQVEFGLVWLPHRYKQIYIYVFVGLLPVVVFLVQKFWLSL